jgi:hypothetical protein
LELTLVAIVGVSRPHVSIAEMRHHLADHYDGLRASRFVIITLKIFFIKIRFNYEVEPKGKLFTFTPSTLKTFIMFEAGSYGFSNFKVVNLCGV